MAICTPERPVVDANQLPPLPYHLVDMQQKLQPDARGKRTTSYFTSYGCPYRSLYLLLERRGVFGPRWYALTPERVVEDLERLVQQWGANHLVIDDANFFVSRKRVRRMCELIIERGLEGKITWDATGTANVVAKFDDELLTLLRRGGCSAIFIGAESGSQELIDVFKKPITGEHVVQSADKLGRHGIVPYIGFVVGTPGEPADALARERIAPGGAVPPAALDARASDRGGTPPRRGERPGMIRGSASGGHLAGGCTPRR